MNMELTPNKRAILQLQEEKRQLSEDLQQSLREKRGVQASYEEALNQLSESKSLIGQLNEELKQTKYELDDTIRELDTARGLLESHGIEVLSEHTMDKINEVVDSTSFSLHKLSLSNELPDFTAINCKLCGEIVQVENMNNHSRRCSTSSPTKDTDISKWLEHITKQDNSLHIILTRSSPLSGETAPFKVITKMRLEHNKHKCVEVYRSHGDFYWLYSALQVACPERIIPPLQHHISLFETITEFQRFLNRLSSHMHLKTHPLLSTFLSGSNESIRLARASYRESRSETGALSQLYRPHTREGDQDTSLADTKNYLVSLEGNLLGLHSHFQDIRKLNYGGASKWLEALSTNEPRDTFTKIVIMDIARIFQSMNNSQTEDSSEDWTFLQNLESTIQYITSARGLLERIEDSMNKYLFWEGEVQSCENANSVHSICTVGNQDNLTHSICPVGNQDNLTPPYNSPCDSNEDLSVFDDSGMSESGGSSNNGAQFPTAPIGSSNLSHKWAEANSQCSVAREQLENMCNNLATELAHFDYLKEKDIRDILIDFVNTQHEHMQKVQSKWYAMKLILESPIERANRSIEFIYEDQEST